MSVRPTMDEQSNPKNLQLYVKTMWKKYCLHSFHWQVVSGECKAGTLQQRELNTKSGAKVKGGPCRLLLDGICRTAGLIFSHSILYMTFTQPLSCNSSGHKSSSSHHVKVHSSTNTCSLSGRKIHNLVPLNQLNHHLVSSSSCRHPATSQLRD